MTSGKRRGGQDIDALIARLPANAADLLYDEIAQGDGEGSRLLAVRKALVGKLNAERRQHARRLFTDLFRPLLTHDPLLLRAEFTSTGVIHPLDLGGLWARLSARSLSVLGRRIEALLTDLAQDMPLRVAFQDSRVAGLQEALVAQAVQTLGSILGAGDARVFLEEVNRWRSQEARRMKLGFDPRPMTLDDLRLFQAVLSHLPHLTELLEGLQAPANDQNDPRLIIERKAAAFARAPEPVQRLGHLLPLALIHGERNYTAGRLALLHGPRSWHEPVVVAVVKHVGRTAFALTEELLAAIGAGEIVRPGLSIPSSRQALLDGELAHLDALLGILEDLDLINHPRYGTLARDYLDRMVRRVEGEFYPVLVERCAAEARNISRPIPDFEALDWVLSFCDRWRTVLKRSLFWGTGHSDFRDHVIEHLREGFRGSFTRPGYGGVVQRIGHALRLSQLGARLDGQSAGWVGLLDQGVVRTVSDRLRDPETISRAEAQLLQGFADRAAEELKRTRHWRDPALQDLVDLAAGRPELQPD